MTSVFEMTLAENHGDKIAAAVDIARSLMTDEPERFKAGYTAENAAYAVQDIYRLTDDQRGLVLEQVRS